MNSTPENRTSQNPTPLKPTRLNTEPQRPTDICQVCDQAFVVCV